MSRAERVRYRRHIVGFVRQQTARNLVPYLTARQMVDLPMTIAGTPRREQRRARTAELLEALGRRRTAPTGGPTQMSGGEQQRVAIARGAGQPAAGPARRRADRRAGHRRPRRRSSRRCARRTASSASTVVIVTHDPAVSGQVERTVAIRDGRTSSEVLRSDDRRDGDRS